MLSQSQIARYLDQCTDNDGVDEVLSAYVLSKMMNGSNCAQVLYKLHLLCCYLQVTNRGHILRLGQEGFKAICTEISLGGERIGRSPAVTKAGIAVWNELRRNKKFRLRDSMTDSTYGGPAFLTPAQAEEFRRSMTADSPARPEWMERYYSSRLENLDAVAFALPVYNLGGRAELPAYANIDGDANFGGGLDAVARGQDLGAAGGAVASGFLR